MQFRSRGHGRGRRVYPIRGQSRHRKERFRERIHQVRSRPMTLSEVEREAERLGANPDPYTVIAVRYRKDGKFDSYLQGYRDGDKARRTARTLRDEGYDVALAKIDIHNGSVSRISMDISEGRAWR